ncbi:hypothetical protein Hanom_Chr07g00675421 [Helianthus anomalus]
MYRPCKVWLFCVLLIIIRVNYKIFPLCMYFSFMYVLNCRFSLLTLKLTSFVFNVSKSCTLCSFTLTQLDFLVKYGHVLCT